MREAGCAADILATDIDSEVLRVAQAGVYRAERIESMPQARALRKHFLRGAGANDGLVSLRPELRSMVRFAQLNLQAPAWPVHEPFDAIFCRNVVIYFDAKCSCAWSRDSLRLLAPGGLLVIGHSESFPTGHPAFRSCGRTAYELRRQGLNARIASCTQAPPCRYFDRDFKVDAVKILPGQYYATSGQWRSSTVLGSCVSTCLRDPARASAA